MLDLIARALGPQLSAQKLSYVRIDGNSSLQQYRDALGKFNSESTYVVMLATIGAVGEGYVLPLSCHPPYQHVLPSTPYLGSYGCTSTLTNERGANA